MEQIDVAIIGGGAAGYFAAIACGQINQDISIRIFEQSKEVLNKVRVSGGGRCNVTHACYLPKELIHFYPRGSKELLGPFHTFGPTQTVSWFEREGVKLKTEDDGRMFPSSNTSETIIQCFTTRVQKLGIQVKTNAKVKDIQIIQTEGNTKFLISTENDSYSARKLLIATGSSPFIWSILKKLNFEIIEPVPSLFTFNLPKHPIINLMGLSVPNARVTIEGTKIKTEGPILITHWGLSGPAILKASAWGATQLAETNYSFTAAIDWISDVAIEDILDLRSAVAKKKVWSNAIFGLPTRLWQFFLNGILSDHDKNWASLSKTEMDSIVKQLKDYKINVKGKTTFKEEFVTAGGIALHQIDFKSFESKQYPGLHFAGEVLNIDAVTGGFNFQAAWTGGYLAGQAMAKHLSSDK